MLCTFVQSDAQSKTVIKSITSQAQRISLDGFKSSGNFDPKEGEYHLKD